jgi:hypothetical protein
MKIDQLYRNYVDKMEEAEKAAARTGEEYLRGRWLTIAKGYRILAAEYKKRIDKWRGQANTRS